MTHHASIAGRAAMAFAVRHSNLLVMAVFCALAYALYKTGYPALGLFLLSIWGVLVADYLDEAELATDQVSEEE